MWGVYIGVGKVETFMWGVYTGVGKVEAFNVTAQDAKVTLLLNKDIRFDKCSVNEFIILTILSLSK